MFVIFHFFQILYSIIVDAQFLIFMFHFYDLDHFTATCGDDFIADKEIRSFSIKDYLDGYPPDVECWWNIKSQSANEIIWVWADTPDNVQVTLESPVCFYFAIGVFFSSSSGDVKYR